MRHLRTALIVVAANLVLLLGGELVARWLHLPDRMNGFPRRLILATAARRRQRRGALPRRRAPERRRNRVLARALADHLTRQERSE